MSANEAFGLKWKDREAELSRVLPESMVGIRLDGRAFHTFTRDFDRPFDTDIMAAMDAGMLEVLEDLFPNALCGYTQSDEVTIILDFRDSEAPFSGRLDKLLTLAASTMSVAFALHLVHVGAPRPVSGPTFDARAFLLHSMEEAHENITWRRLDARKNAVSAAASALYPERELHGKSTRERAAMLEGTPHEQMPDGVFNGRLAVRQERIEEVTYTIGGTLRTVMATRYPWTIIPATREATQEVFDA